MNNHIVFNREQAMIENYFKNLSNNLQEAYEEEGKYLFLGSHFHLAITYIFVGLLTLVISIKMNVPESITILIFMIETIIYISLIVSGKDALKNAKLPIISKKQFLKNNSVNLNRKLFFLNLSSDEVIIDSKKLEIKLNYESPTLLEKMKNRQRQILGE